MTGFGAPIRRFPQDARIALAVELIRKRLSEAIPLKAMAAARAFGPNSRFVQVTAALGG
jgi:hypothetical protein